MFYYFEWLSGKFEYGEECVILKVWNNDELLMLKYYVFYCV